MPRGRSRKPRLSRMDAAVDAMVPFGFPVEKVKKHVKELLGVYGGNAGWPFIEEYAYKELIEAILRDVEENDEEQVAEDDNEWKEKEYAAGRVLEPQQDQGPENNSPPNIAGAISEPKCPEFVSTSSRINNGDEKGWEENEEDPKIHVPSKSPVPSSPPLNCTTPSLQPTNGRAPHRRQPCYGWIESDEEDIIDDFVFLKPALREKAAGLPHDGTKPRVKRRSRWDLGPDDP